MSALPVTPAPATPAPDDQPGRGRARRRGRRDHLRLVDEVTCATPVGPSAPTGVPVTPARLAPADASQARRRQIGVLVVLAAVVTLLAGAVGDGAADPTAPAPVTGLQAAPDATVVVQPGETLWDVARANVPADTSTGEYAALLVEVNGLRDAAVDPWQVLRLPGTP